MPSKPMVRFNTKSFEKTMLNIVDYSVGFLDGAKLGHVKFLNNLAKGTIEVFKQYVDTNARLSPGALHHIYEWYQTGSPDGRLYKIDYVIDPTGMIVFNSTFKQSRTIKNGSSEPFYDKAEIMENGIPVLIKPKKRVLAFDIDGEQIFTPNPVKVDNPGGQDVQGAYEKVFDTFFSKYFTQSFLKASGLFNYLENPMPYKKNFNAGGKQGKQKGIQTGYNWIVNATIEVE